MAERRSQAIAIRASRSPKMAIESPLRVQPWSESRKRLVSPSSCRRLISYRPAASIGATSMKPETVTVNR